ncbi:hypothetical protein [Bradyrhizobium tropiciagri]|uniref:hypothetical protein n=1 Tax=Bradyrhizobium tropiciagri TaxID=312253 RepID=UPI003D9BBEE1
MSLLGEGILGDGLVIAARVDLVGMIVIMMRNIVGVRGIFLDLFRLRPLGFVIELDGVGGIRRCRGRGGLDHSGDGIALWLAIRRCSHLSGMVVLVLMVVRLSNVVTCPMVVGMMIMGVMIVGVIVGMHVVMVVIMAMLVVMCLVLVTIVLMAFVLMAFVFVAFMGHHAVVVVLGVAGNLVIAARFGRRLLACALDHLALHALAMAAAAGVAVARAAAVAAVFLLFLGLAMGALFGLDQRLTVGDRDLVIIGMDFAEGEEAVPVAAILDEGGLQRRLYARHLGEVDITAQLFALGGLEIKFFDAIATDHNDPGLFRVGGIDQHLVGHFGALDGGGHGAWRAQIAPPADATVHLIRG